MSKISMELIDFWDWQVTSSFYVGVHLVNAHIEKRTGQHYRSHEAVKEALNPYNVLSLTKLPEEVYTAYNKLQWLSRRSRYLCKDVEGDKSTQAHFTYDVHFSRALGYLNLLLQYMNKEYGLGFTAFDIHCLEAENKKFEHFVHIKKESKESDGVAV